MSPRPTDTRGSSLFALEQGLSGHKLRKYASCAILSSLFVRCVVRTHLLTRCRLHPEASAIIHLWRNASTHSQCHIACLHVSLSPLPAHDAGHT
jgi:hypothetical protein